ncbi:MAG: DUF1127 domain-containing protein [Rhizobiales bacterium]|nr:DUF1127 domain-containing protein [Hyphomicrobiales bacterium]
MNTMHDRLSQNAQSVEGSSWLDQFSRWVDTTLIAPLRNRQTYWRTVRTLEGLDDRMLRDVGIERHQICAIARRCAEEQSMIKRRSGASKRANSFTGSETLQAA